MLILEVGGTGSRDAAAPALQPGDVVEVVEGDLKNLTGRVVSLEGDSISVKPHHKDLQDLLAFQARELRKAFKEGDHVKVVAGRYEGETGLVVRIEHNLAILFSDLTMHELKVRPQDLQLCLETSSGVDASGQYQLGDMVQLDPQTVGVIVRLEKEAFKVLTQHGKEVNAKPHALQLRKSRGVALDSRQNEITSRDVVKVIQGPHIHKQGEIKHVFRGNVFLIVRDQVENGGIVVAKAKHVELAGGTSHAASSISTGFMPQSPRLSSPAPHRGPGTVSISSSAITTVLVASSATTTILVASSATTTVLVTSSATTTDTCCIFCH
ncbi:Transcription elongation factor SPT5, partial [Geodia barretti]